MSVKCVCDRERGSRVKMLARIRALYASNYALFSRAISSDRAHFSPFRRLFSAAYRERRAVTRAIR